MNQPPMPTAFDLLAALLYRSSQRPTHVADLHSGVHGGWDLLHTPRDLQTSSVSLWPHRSAGKISNREDPRFSIFFWKKKKKNGFMGFIIFFFLCFSMYYLWFSDFSEFLSIPTTTISKLPPFFVGIVAGYEYRGQILVLWPVSQRILTGIFKGILCIRDIEWRHGHGSIYKIIFCLA